MESPPSWDLKGEETMGKLLVALGRLPSHPSERKHILAPHQFPAVPFDLRDESRQRAHA